MHYHMEIVMPPTDDVAAAVEKILAPFSENDEEARHAFWDWYQLGGRYSGAKLEARVPKEKREAFFVALKQMGVTVSGLQWGKQELSPASQAPAVDALWREMCPGAGATCPIFKHSGEGVGVLDICTLSEVPDELAAYSLIIAGPNYAGELAAAELSHQSIWNGVTHQDTTFKGGVKAAIDEFLERINSYTDEYKERLTPKPDWLVVTVDYHS